MAEEPAPQPLPTRFVGAWRRVSIALGGGPPREPADVLWLQAPSAFADIRLPAGPGVEPLAFAGITTWDAPALTWHHRLDLSPSGPDVGAVEWRGDDEFVERGVTCIDGEPSTYQEVWRREPGPAAPVAVLTHAAADGACAGMLVRIGNDAIVIARTDRGIAARRDRRDAARWWTVGSVGPAMLLPAVPDVTDDWEPGAQLRIGPVRAAAGEQVSADWLVAELTG